VSEAQTEKSCPLCAGAGHLWRRKRGFTIYLCRSCENAFLPPDQIPKNLEDIYSKAYFEGEETTGYPSYLKDQPIILRNFTDRLKWIERLGVPGRRLLDVGAAYGLLLKAARESGWDAEGVEIAPDCAAEAARLSGTRVTAGDFLSVPLDGRFDVIVMFDVIEHLRDPLASLKRAHDLLVPGGRLVIETCDHTAPWARLLGERWYFLDPPQHLFYFSKRGLDWLFTRAGFSPDVAQRRLGRRVSLANVSFKLAKELPQGIRKHVIGAARKGLPGSVYLNFWDAMLLGAKRPD
jgi:SAM-dependent methyltransferase